MTDEDIKYTERVLAGEVTELTLWDDAYNKVPSRLNDHISIKSGRSGLVIAPTNTGKSGWVDDMLVIKTIVAHIRHKVPMPSLIIRAMERKAVFRRKRWTAALAMELYGFKLDYLALMGEGGRRPTPEEVDMEKQVAQAVGHIYEQYIDLRDKQVTPQSVMDYAVGVFLKRGEMFTVDGDQVTTSRGKTYKCNVTREMHGGVQYGFKGRERTIWESDQLYIPDNPSSLLVHVTDTINRFGDSKAVVDEHFTNMTTARDVYGAATVEVCQMSDDVLTTERRKEFGPSMSLRDIKLSRKMGEEADWAIGFMDMSIFPEIEEFLGYELDKTKVADKHQAFRAVYLLKNTYGGNSGRMPMFFDGATGRTRDLPTLPNTSTYGQIQNRFHVQRR